MESRDRVLATLQHREPDRIPFDLGGSPNAGIHVIAYERLLEFWGESKPITVADIVAQRAVVDEADLRRLGVDVRLVDMLPSIAQRRISQLEEDERYSYFTDDWGITWMKPKYRGLYYDLKRSPLAGARLSASKIDALPLPPLPTEDEVTKLRERAKKYREDGFAVVLDGLGGGMFETACFIRGHKDFLMDMLRRPNLAARLLDKLLYYRMQYWKYMLSHLGDLVDVVSESDDIATQERLLISPKLYRSLLKPRHRELFNHIRKNAESQVFILFHSCGAVRELIPDLIEAGIDALNPVQVSAAGMDTKVLKREFGRDLTFWGGGVDTQHVLPYGRPSDVKDEVKRRIEDLGPGGGFVFAAVHNIQPGVPPENIMAMWEALQEWGKY